MKPLQAPQDSYKDEALRAAAEMSITSEPWMADALCARSDDPDLWFKEGLGRSTAKTAREREAIAICQSCPVRMQCLEYGNRINARYGIWGGLTVSQRSRRGMITRYGEPK